MPSFSLGLTPPDQGVGWGDMNANAPKHQVDGHAECAGGDGTIDVVPLEGTVVSEASLGRMPSSDVVGVEIFITPQPQVGVSSPVVDEGAGERGVLAEPLKGLMPDIEGREIGGIGHQLLAEYTQTVVETSGDKKDRCVWFSDRLREDYDIAPHQSWATIDMFLFPLSDHGHYYIISVDLKKMKMDIIDNCPTPATHKSRYGSALTDLVRAPMSLRICCASGLI
nr:uncharacterized protein LOC109168900 [Ipomoea batatas]